MNKETLLSLTLGKNRNLTLKYKELAYAALGNVLQIGILLIGWELKQSVIKKWKEISGIRDNAVIDKSWVIELPGKPSFLHNF